MSVAAAFEEPDGAPERYQELLRVRLHAPPTSPASTKVLATLTRELVSLISIKPELVHLSINFGFYYHLVFDDTSNAWLTG